MRLAWHGCHVIFTTHTDWKRKQTNKNLVYAQCCGNDPRFVGVGVAFGFRGMLGSGVVIGGSWETYS